VVKALAAGLPHKTEAGGVVVGVGNAAELEQAIARIVAAVAAAAPGVALSQVLVCEMVSEALELILGVINDSVFGPVVMLGLGGTLTEVIGDAVYRVAPCNVDTARAMIAELRGSRLFAGARGRPAADVDALAQLVSDVSRLAWERRDSLLERRAPVPGRA
jgi:hypothetical protein